MIDAGLPERLQALSNNLDGTLHFPPEVKSVTPVLNFLTLYVIL